MAQTFLDNLKGWLPGGGGPVIPVLRLTGAIGQVGRLRSGLPLSAAAGALKKAFDTRNAPAVALVVDSPGGSPVQSHLLYKRIRTLADEKGKRVHVFVEDVCASGGYMIACAGDEIIVDPASIVGSIGVVSAGFGFVEALNKLGIERRVHTAGEAKVLLDPFQPERPEEVARLKALQEEVHEHFIDIVRARRGDVLADDPDLFTGMFWSGKRAVALGLADRTGDMRAYLRERYGADVRLRPIALERPFFARRLPGFGGSIGEAMADRLLAEIEERAWRARYGL